jgi:hypothetical protein
MEGSAETQEYGNSVRKKHVGGSVRIKIMVLGSIIHKSVTIGSLRMQNHGYC